MLSIIAWVFVKHQGVHETTQHCLIHERIILPKADYDFRTSTEGSSSLYQPPFISIPLQAPPKIAHALPGIDNYGGQGPPDAFFLSIPSRRLSYCRFHCIHTASPNFLVKWLSRTRRACEVQLWRLETSLMMLAMQFACPGIAIAIVFSKIFIMEEWVPAGLSADSTMGQISDDTNWRP